MSPGPEAENSAAKRRREDDARKPSKHCGSGQQAACKQPADRDADASYPVAAALNRVGVAKKEATFAGE